MALVDVVSVTTAEVSVRTVHEPGPAPRVAADAPARVSDQKATNDLTAKFLDLRGCYEANLRRLTSMQRMLETVRAGQGGTGEARLLLQEMERYVEELMASALAVREDLLTAVRHIDAVRLTALAPRLAL